MTIDEIYNECIKSKGIITDNGYEYSIQNKHLVWRLIGNTEWDCDGIKSIGEYLQELKDAYYEALESKTIITKGGNEYRAEKNFLYCRKVGTTNWKELGV